MLKLEDFKKFETKNLKSISGGFKWTTLNGVVEGDAIQNGYFYDLNDYSRYCSEDGGIHFSPC